MHLALSINVPLRALGKYYGNETLQRLIDEEGMEVGDAGVAAACASEDIAWAR